MALNLPSAPDFQFENSPLVEVVCQIRFPIVLRILNEQPSEFQDLIRHQFPLLKLEQGVVVKVPKLGNEEPPEVDTTPRIYRFWTKDNQAAISLAPDFYALSTKKYTNWDDFVQYLSLAHQSVQKIYTPAYATRVGLRYINRFTLTNTGSGNVSELFEILRPELLPQFHSEIWDEPIELRSRLQFMDDEAKLTLAIRYGQEQDEPFLLLDFDYFEEGQIALENLVERCAHYNSVIYRTFCWCIRDEKLGILKPKAKEVTHS